MTNTRLTLAFSIGLLTMGASSLLAAEQWTGWLTDQACAKTSNFSGAIHAKHVADGQPLVFVSEKDSKVYPVSNPDKVKSLVGEKVTLKGTAKADGMIEAESAMQAN